ncbi:MAG: hypothetical protein WAU01_09490 [Saprospiraceae bacterium]
MKLIHNLEFMDRVNTLIRMKGTGDAASFTKKLGKSTRNVHRLISEMKESGFPIKYHSEEKTYYFEETVKYEFHLTIGNQDLIKIKGGRKVGEDMFDLDQVM